jgi:hypothetical protein
VSLRRTWALPLSGVFLVLLPTAPAFAQFLGGFVELATSVDVRPLLTPPQLELLLPARGPFVFPPPYLTQGVRVTNASDCGGNDCVNYVGYSYWRTMNNHVGSDTLLIFLTLDRGRGGAGPTLFSYNKVTDTLTKVGPLFEPTSPFSRATGETWYFSATRPTALYLNDGPRLLRYDVVARTFETVLDVSTQPAPFGADRAARQTHSSDDDRVHSATLEDTTTSDELGCFAYREDTGQFFYFPRLGFAYDECQIDKSGRWLLIKEKLGTDPQSEVDNRIIDLTTGAETDLLDRDGAGGHSDNGFGYMVAADNWNPLPNAIRLRKFGPNPLAAGGLVYYDSQWRPQSVEHISHGNARADVPPEQQYVCGSGANAVNGPRVNEIVCIPLDGSLRVLVVAPVMTDMNAPGGGTGYSKLPKGNLDVTGQYFIWTSNLGGSRLDAFIVKVPSQMLTLPDTSPPTVSMTAPSSGTTVKGTVTVSASAADDRGVVGVQFKLDGADLGSERTSAPYARSWNTLMVANGAHTLTAVARDAAGNTAIAVPVTVMVNNPDLTLPTVAITAPTSNPTYATSNPLLTLGGTASDNTGVAQVAWMNSRDGSGIAAGTTSWTAAGIALRLGTNVLTVTARDVDGNIATASLTVTLSGPFTFTDGPLVTPGTPVRAVHIMEARAAIDSVRVALGLTTFAWTDPTLTPQVTAVRVVHLTELRAALNEAYQATGRTPPTYTDPAVGAGLTIIQAIHLNELRTAVRALP